MWEPEVSVNAATGRSGFHSNSRGDRRPVGACRSLPSSHSIPGDSVENCDPVARGAHHLRTYRRLWDPVAV